MAAIPVVATHGCGKGSHVIEKQGFIEYFSLLNYETEILQIYM